MVLLTTEQKNFIKESYKEDSDVENISFLATKFDVSRRSIIAILTAASLYKKPKYTTKTGEKPTNKSEIIEIISSTIGIPSDQLEGLDKCPKVVLRIILKALDSESDRYFK